MTTKKNSHLLALLLPAALFAVSITAIPCAAQTLPPLSPFGSKSETLDEDGFEIDFDGTKYRFPTTVGSPQEVKKNPVFDNAPFLRLKNGDKLVKGKWRNPKGGQFADRDKFYLSSQGKFYDLDNYGGITDFHLWNLSPTLHFDWDLTLENAAHLYAIHNERVNFPLNLKQYASLRKALQQDFPESLENDLGLTLREPSIKGTADKKHAVFESIALDTFTNKVFHYRILIGPGVYTIKRKTLISGPRAVRSEEYLGRAGGGINGTFPYYPDKETAAKALAADQKSQAFRKIVASVLPQPSAESLLRYRDF